VRKRVILGRVTLQKEEYLYFTLRGMEVTLRYEDAESMTHCPYRDPLPTLRRELNNIP